MGDAPEEILAGYLGVMDYPTKKGRICPASQDSK
jgi:hypothetical protein